MLVPIFWAHVKERPVADVSEQHHAAIVTIYVRGEQLGRRLSLLDTDATDLEHG
jgi:hypothetical protein